MNLTVYIPRDTRRNTTCVEGCVRPPPSLARMVHHHTTPRTYIFPGGSPTFATITPVAAAFVRATHARRPSCRVHAEAGTRKPRFVSREYASSRFLLCVATLRRLHVDSTKWCGSFPVSSSLRKRERLLWLRALSERDRRRATPFPCGVARGLRDMCATWTQTEDPPASPAEWD